MSAAWEKPVFVSQEIPFPSTNTLPSRNRHSGFQCQGSMCCSCLLPASPPLQAVSLLRSVMSCSGSGYLLHLCEDKHPEFPRGSDWVTSLLVVSLATVSVQSHSFWYWVSLPTSLLRWNFLMSAKILPAYLNVLRQTIFCQIQNQPQWIFKLFSCFHT